MAANCVCQGRIRRTCVRPPARGCKINIDSDIRLASDGLYLPPPGRAPKNFDPRAYLKPAREAVRSLKVDAEDVWAAALAEGQPIAHPQLNGPVVDPASTPNVVSSQSEVDDLLASLGF